MPEEMRAAEKAEAEGSNGASLRPARGRRKKEVLLWDDEAFRHRVQDLARQQGHLLSAVMDAAGVAGDYTYHHADGRNTNVIMRLAQYLGVTPGELAGWEPASPETHILRSVERQNAVTILIALGMARGDDIGVIAQVIGAANPELASVLRTLPIKEP